MKQFIITEEEKKRILGMHKSATSNHYLTEQELTGSTTNQPKAGDPVSVDQLPQEIQDFVKTYGLTGTFNQTSVNGVFGKTFGYRKGNTSSDLSVELVNTYETNKSQYNKCIERSNRWNELTKSIDVRRDPRKYEEVKKTLNSEFPNTNWCGAAIKVQGIINLK